MVNRRYFLKYAAILLLTVPMVGCDFLIGVTLDVTLGYFPDDCFRESFDLIVGIYSVSDDKYTLLESTTAETVSPTSDDITLEIKTNKRANYIGAYLFDPDGTTPKYFMEWEISSSEELSYTNHFWIKTTENDGDRCDFGISKKMLEDIEYDTAYTLNFQHQPYHLFRLPSSGVSSIDATVTSLEGYVMSAKDDLEDLLYEYYEPSDVSLDSTNFDIDSGNCFFLYYPKNYSIASSITLNFTDQTLTEYDTARNSQSQSGQGHLFTHNPIGKNINAYKGYRPHCHY